ncbi:MAG: nuclear transport factor 2 family protein [Steroidobacteraceae bacterium]
MRALSPLPGKRPEHVPGHLSYDANKSAAEVPVVKMVGSIMFGSLLACQAACASSLEESLSAYVEGLRTGNVKTLEKLFHKDGQFCLNSADGIECSSFAAVLPTWAAKPDPGARGKVKAMEVIGDSMASVTYELQFGERSYVDHLLLYIQEGHWVVVAKTTFIANEPT